MTVLSVQSTFHSYEDDLIIDFSELLAYPSQLLINSWQQGINWMLKVNGVDELYEYLEEAPIPLVFIKERECYHHWYNGIPEQIRQLAQHYKSIEFTALYLTSRYSAAYELFIHQPTLFFLLIKQAKEEKWEELKLTELLTYKRIDLLQACQLPARRSVLKLLQKMAFKHYGNPEYGYIKQLLALPNYEKLNHLESIDEFIAKLICRYPELVATRLINNYQKHHWQQSVYALFDDICRMATYVGVENIIKRIGACESIDQVERVHDRLVDQLNQLEAAVLSEVNYQAPPFAGTDCIIPIINSQSLVEEGKEQRHCIASYHAHIVHRRYYVYRVTYPERATLGITLQEGLKPELDQLKLKRNHPVSEETNQYVLKWLSKAIKDYEI